MSKIELTKPSRYMIDHLYLRVIQVYDYQNRLLLKASYDNVADPNSNTIIIIGDYCYWGRERYLYSTSGQHSTGTIIVELDRNSRFLMKCTVLK